MHNNFWNNPSEFWRRKLAALLHDPPDKCFDIAGHEKSAVSFLKDAGFTEDEEARAMLHAVKEADHFASAADRFVFPKGECSTKYDGKEGSSFLHPLSSKPYLIREDMQGKANHLHTVLKDAAYGIDSDDWRVRFFLYWRRWMENAITADKLYAEHLAFSPADSRIPDHSIWTHMAVTSAVAGCFENIPDTHKHILKPAFLLFQLGPVQEFIAQAHSTRDLWSGSYLLSWLMAHAMKAVSDRIGPDAIIFPSLRGNGIFDALHREEMYATRWQDKNRKEVTTWERMKQDKGPDRVARWLLTPTLPNRFLALVPESKAEALADLAASAVQAELQRIGEAVWEWIDREAQSIEPIERNDTFLWKQKWDAQLAAFAQITWAVQPWLDRDTCLQQFRDLPVNRERIDKEDTTPIQRLQDMLDLAEKWLPLEDRDPRYYIDSKKKDQLNNLGALWVAHYALVDARLAARRNTRDFPAWTDPCPSENGSPKDSLSGKEECIGNKDFWKHLTKNHDMIFTGPKHRYGAMNLIKRLWCRSDKVPYLEEKLGLSREEFRKAIRFETVEDIAGGNENGGPYVAILAMDGDEMGKWVSGEKMPFFLPQLSDRAKGYLQPILEKEKKENIRRLLTPSYHLQFSEALANFSTWLAEPIVNSYDGQMIYSGGDDVLAILPADRAIPCAQALRAAFRGENPHDKSIFHIPVHQEGYVPEIAGYPLIVPGPAADVSIGLAIGHYKAPLQMLVREAQRAEKSAKKTYGRSAMAIALYKRSGEIIHWGCKWDNEDDKEPKIAIKLMKLITRLSSGDNPMLPGRFPYALAQLLKPYMLEKHSTPAWKLFIPPSPGEKTIKPYSLELPYISTKTLQKLMNTEFQHLIDRPGVNIPEDDKKELVDLVRKWSDQTIDRLDDFVKLFLVETFIHRRRGENE